MGILSDLELPSKRPNCKVRTVLNSLEPDDEKVLLTALANPLWKASTLSDALFKKGIVLDGKLITRHRKQLCSCRNENA